MQIDTQQSIQREFLEWMLPGSELSGYLFLTIIFRADPMIQSPETPSGLSTRCVDSARNALLIHQQFVESFKNMDVQLFKGYINW